MYTVDVRVVICSRSGAVAWAVEVGIDEHGKARCQMSPLQHSSITSLVLSSHQRLAPFSCTLDCLHAFECCMIRSTRSPIVLRRSTRSETIVLLRHHGLRRTLCATNPSHGRATDNTQKAFISPTKSQDSLQVPFIDPSSLRRTLDVVRTANRTTLIRKVDGRWSSRYTPEEALQLQDIGTDDPGRLHVSEKKLETTDRSVTEVVQSHERVVRRVELKDDSSAGYHGPRDYCGRAMPLTSQWSAVKGRASPTQCPWLSHLPPSMSHAVMPAKERLAQELMAFDAYARPTPAEESAAEQAIDDICKAIKHADGRWRPEVIGSRANGTATPLSDLDFNLVTEEGTRLDHVQDRERAAMMLLRLSDRLRKRAAHNQNIKITAMLSRPRIPIVQGVHLPTGLEFQIQQTTSAYNSTEYVKAYLNEYPTLRALFVIVKQALIMRGLTKGTAQGLTSYPLLNMIIASLKLKDTHVGRDDVAGHFLAFLDMYSHIDFYTNGILVSPPRLISKDEAISRATEPASHDNIESDTQDSEAGLTNGAGSTAIFTKAAAKKLGSEYSMYLEDPADPSNNLGRNGYKIKHVQATLMQLLQELRIAMDEWDSLKAGSQSQSANSLLKQCIGGNYRAFELDRLSLQHMSLDHTRRIASKDNSDDSDFVSSMEDWSIHI